MKNNLEYYQHKVDSHNHWKFKSLRREYFREFKQDGWAGEGKFWALNNMIAESEGASLCLDHSIKLASIAADLDFSIEEFEIFLDILVTRCKLMKRTSDCLTTKRIELLYRDVEQQRERERERKHRKNTETSAGKEKFPPGKNKIPPEKENFHTDSTPENIHSKVKYSKVYNKDTIVSSADADEKTGVIGVKNNPDELNGNVVKSGKKKRTPGAKKKLGRDPDSEPHWKVLRRVWVDFNRTHLKFNVEPIPSADYSHMHRIIENLRERAIGQAVIWTEQEAVVRWEKFLSFAYNKDQWLHDNFLLINLYTQRQTIFKLCENGHTGSQINGKAKQNSFNSGPNIDTNATSSGSWK